jgi:hypothetical protein
MSLILFSQTIFGNLVAFRILRRFRHRALISTTSLTKIGTAFALSLSVTLLFFFREREPLLFIIATLVVLQVALKLKERRNIERLAGHFPHFLDRWLLNLRMGFASSTARERALSSSEGQFRALVAPIFESRTAEHHLFLSYRDVQELRSASLEPHSTVGRLENLRRCVARRAGFRRRSIQALKQATIQSAVLISLHTALCIFILTRGDARAHTDLIAGSSLLTACGVLILRLMARRIRWTI